MKKQRTMMNEEEEGKKKCEWNSSTLSTPIVFERSKMRTLSKDSYIDQLKDKNKKKESGLREWNNSTYYTDNDMKKKLEKEVEKSKNYCKEATKKIITKSSNGYISPMKRVELQQEEIKNKKLEEERLQRLKKAQEEYYAQSFTLNLVKKSSNTLEPKKQDEQTFTVHIRDIIDY
ncbi:hypothetical protein ABK040_006314 [Willaertia magna]